MAIVRKITPYIGETKTSLNGVTDDDCTYEVAEGMLILRTTSHSTVHISKEAARALVGIVVNELLTD